MKKETFTKAVVFAVAVAITMPVYAQDPLSIPHKYENPTGKEFPIMAWYSVPGGKATKERFQELRAAGFNLSMHPSEDEEALGKTLDLALGTGVKLMASHYKDFCGNPAPTVKKYRKHKALGGWFLKDEPQMQEFASLAEAARKVRAVDDSHILYLNLFPYVYDHSRPDVEIPCFGANSYDEYVQKFIDSVKLGMISYDFYPVITNGDWLHLKPEYYHSLEVISAKATKAGVPFWAFSLATCHNTNVDHYPVATREQIRLQIFSDLAYGAQGIQYFTYWNPFNADFEYSNAPITDGKRTEVYDIISDINHEVQRLSWVFLGAKMHDVSHTGDSIAWRVKRLGTLPPQFSEVSTTGSDIVVSQFTNGKRRFLMVLSADIVNRQKVTVKAADGVKRILPDGTSVKASLYNSSMWLSPGDYLLFEY